MDYRALEDLINILVSKTGNSLDDSIEDYRKTKVEKALAANAKDKISLNIRQYAKDILYAFKNKKSYNSVKEKAEFLVAESKKALDQTLGEIDDSNVFEVVNKHIKDAQYLRSKIDKKDYIDEENIRIQEFLVAYKDKKIQSIKSRISVLQNQVDLLEKIIQLLTEELSRIKKLRSTLSEKLESNKQRLYNDDLKFKSEQEFDDLERVVTKIEEQLNSLKSIEEKYEIEIDNYISEQKSKKVEILFKQTEIGNEKEINFETKDNIGYLMDEIEYFSSLRKSKSVSLQQKYLYVDSDVIKEEIELLFKKNSDDLYEDIELFEA